MVTPPLHGAGWKAWMRGELDSPPARGTGEEPPSIGTLNSVPSFRSVQ